MSVFRPLTRLRLRPPRHLHLTTHHHKPYSTSSPSSPPPPPPPPLNIETYLCSAYIKFNSQLPKLLPAILKPDKTDQLTVALTSTNPSLCQSHDEYEENDPLPQGYHMVYFEPPSSSYEAMGDGTDPYHFPGKPFERRMWTGGSVTFTPAYRSHMLLSEKTKAECIETVNPKATKFKGGDMVFVEINRDYYVASPQEETKTKVLSETRNLVFLRPLEKVSSPEAKGESTEPPTAALSDLTIKETAVLPPRKKLTLRRKPLFTYPLVPTQELLSLFSSLTYNNHLIHLSTRYVRKEEGHKDTLVHGPLTLVLLLEGLTSHLYRTGQKGKWVRELSYRNLAPLYRGDELRICGARAVKRKGVEQKDGEEGWVVWIEDFEGGLAVKGTAVVMSK
ncbi:hypothetical protein QBC40DRAFT_257746 [Triangularia verruculosa]|uniref:MaoC-like domain-containing protein n=1 Tax=Triangularia verruculosa TaxID=2587418 RepID=A0AAN6XC70_9PEZI|nr:hypothetical protein QBC40DRAFT_257746 [Triangularia verruculosa]